MMAFFHLTNKFNNCVDDLTELCNEELKSLIIFFFFFCVQTCGVVSEHTARMCTR